jgi:hypothetical protein
VTVAVSCNLSEGVILGVDSAVTVPAPDGNVAKVYEDAEKLFQLGNKSIGAAVFGLGSFGTRSIGSYIREFEIDRKQLIGGKVKIQEVVEELRAFFMRVYTDAVMRPIEQELKKKWDEIPQQQRPLFGLVVGGFSDGEYLSEVWQILLPEQDKKDSAVQSRGQGNFGTNWFAMFDPIFRYIHGFSPQVIDQLVEYFKKEKAFEITDKDQEEIHKILSQAEYQIPFFAMPLKGGIEHTRFLVELVINHHKYAVGAPVVGGKAKIGMVTYKGENFQILE